MGRRTTVLVAVAVAVVGLAVGIVLDQVDTGDEVAQAPGGDPCLSTPPLVAVAGNDPRGQGLARITVIRPDGGQQVVTPADWVATDPAIAPDGRRLAVTLAEDGDYESAGPQWTHIWTLGVDGRDPRQLTDGDLADSSPAWSPDGVTVAFVRDHPGEPQVLTLPADGGEAMVLVPGEPDASVGPLAWSPDGTRLAFVRRRSTSAPTDPASAELWTVAADGSGATQVATVDPDVVTLDWHPDGTQLLVSAFRSEAAGDVARVDLSTGTTTVLLRDATFARWSRGGTHVVHFTRTGVTREAFWRLVETPVIGVEGASLGTPRDLGLTDDLYPYFSLSIAPCPP